MTAPAIFVLTASAMKTAEAIRLASGGEIHGLEDRVNRAGQTFTDARSHIQELFKDGRTIIGVLSAGAIVRLLAPVLEDKRTDPPVLAVSEDGATIVPLLGGHHGANQIARFLSDHLGGHAAITTAGDLRFGVALDEPPQGWTLSNPQHAKSIMARLLAGESIRLIEENCAASWLRDSNLPFSDDAQIELIATQHAVSGHDNQLVYHPKSVVLGLGCERGTDTSEVLELANAALKKANISPSSLSCVASLDLKADETAILDVADHFGVSARFFPASRLELEAHRLANPSEIVFAEVGCHGVAEGAALAAAGPNGDLILEKNKTTRATAALAGSDSPLQVDEVGRNRGHLSVVGIGPGSDDWRSPEVTKLVTLADELVGYSLYLDLLGPLTKDKKRHDFDLGKEEDRVRHAMELAGEGKNVALVCSGDAGIYAMATLVFELLADGGLSDAASRIAIQVSPGISALQGAAARAGAPLGHDFCTISLSDLLTPWEAIQMRVKAAAEGDFVIAFYNPVSKRRRTQLAYARDVLLNHRPDDTPVILATNLGRDGEQVRVVPLADLNIEDVDMLTVVIVGSSETRVVKTGDGHEWVYTPRGYAAKEGTNIGSGS